MSNIPTIVPKIVTLSLHRPRNTSNSLGARTLTSFEGFSYNEIDAQFKFPSAEIQFELNVQRL